MAADDLRFSLIAMAVCAGRTELSKLFQKNQKDPNLTNAKGLTSLHLMCKRDQDHKMMEVFFKMNKENHQSVRVDARDNEGQTPLNLAVVRGFKKVTEVLLRNGADPNLSEEGGQTPLHIICGRERDDYDFAHMFFEVNNELNQIVQVDAKDKMGRTPLHLALLCRHEKLVKLLLKNGVNPNLADEDDDDDADELAQMLSKVSRKKYQTAPRVHVQAKNGDTPLHLAIYSGHVNTIKILLKNGARTNLINKEGWTPLKLAVKKLSFVLVDLLLDHCADLSSFDFPAEYWDYDIEDIDCKFELASGVLAFIEHLENRGYQCDSVKIVKLFIKWKILKMSEDHEKRWYDNEEFARDAKKMKVRDGDPSLSLYDLIRPRSEKPAKLLTYKDYFRFARSKKLRNLKGNHEACADAHLAEEISRRFFLDFARESFMELTSCKLPILCCDIIIERLNRKDLWRVCLAAAGQCS
ncbi:ankyrin-1-like [Trichogramma pretiosum]|uniref:ankyrin-1-like n=1 Tax=Trichogramma pretiosum TaxID=7493 RepID=UPI0006C94453|nr:ankyrin-1-like [Trichogramma pretiosum]